MKVGPRKEQWFAHAPQWVLAERQVLGALPWWQRSSGFQPRAVQASSCPDVHHARPLAGNCILAPLHPSSSYSFFNVEPKHCLLCGIFLNWPHQLSSTHIPTALCHPYQSSSHVLPQRLVRGSVTVTSHEPVTCLISKWFQTDGSLLSRGFSPQQVPAPSGCTDLFLGSKNDAAG